MGENFMLVSATIFLDMITLKKKGNKSKNELVGLHQT